MIVTPLPICLLLFSFLLCELSISLVAFFEVVSISPLLLIIPNVVLPVLRIVISRIPMVISVAIPILVTFLRNRLGLESHRRKDTASQQGETTITKYSLHKSS
jgi:hypothetical protein